MDRDVENQKALGRVRNPNILKFYFCSFKLMFVRNSYFLAGIIKGVHLDLGTGH